MLGSYDKNLVPNDSNLVCKFILSVKERKYL